MPPAISDEELSDTGVEVPIRSAKAKARDKKPINYIEPKVDEFDDDDDDDDDGDVGEPKPRRAAAKTNGVKEDQGDEEEEEDEYIVEAIMSHVINDAMEPMFEVKWEGYERPEDRTWEPEENLEENASEILEEYYRRIGGRETMFEATTKALGTKKRGRRSGMGASSSATKRSKTNGYHPSDSTPPASAKAAQWKPPAGSWDDHIATLDACEDDKTQTLIVYLTWNNGQKTQHPLPVIYKRAPQKMLQFYERHVRIIKKDDGAANE